MNQGEPLSPKSYVHRYLEYAHSLIKGYEGKEPFHLYLKKYFFVNKKHGSRDRKIISSLCYDFFRLGIGVSKVITPNEKFLLATFLVEQRPSRILEELKPAWNEHIHLDVSLKTEMVKDFFSLEKIFPFPNETSKQINFEDFCFAFLIQPKLFIRIRPGYKNAVFDKLKSTQISFEKINENCLAFSNNEKVSEVINIDKEAVIQDYNSQRTLDLLTSNIEPLTSSISLWDSCAASGGKSILACDLLTNIELTVSDTRKNILHNLRDRFRKAGITNYSSFVADLSVAEPVKNFQKSFDAIIADVPCSGSGTWARTPEQILFFNQNDIKRYAALQQKIVRNVLPNLKPDGYLLYITCSVFKKENEENVDLLTKKTELKLIKSDYLKGYEMQADTLFVALFRKS